MATILLVEDDDPIRMLFALVLSKQHTVLQANNGRDGLLLFEQNHVDLIITDLSMPGFDGIALIRAVRATGRPVKIIACSALINHGNIMQIAIEAGADICIQKPINLDAFDNAVATLLGA